jgi:hypothetical protein
VHSAACDRGGDRSHRLELLPWTGRVLARGCWCNTFRDTDLTVRRFGASCPSRLRVEGASANIFGRALGLFVAFQATAMIWLHVPPMRAFGNWLVGN